VFVGGLEGQEFISISRLNLAGKVMCFSTLSVLGRSRPGQTWDTMRVPDRVDGVLNEC